ncbi:MerR family transcriptional regulator [Dactylosporangium sp. AC04546]|uniref:MerR family transcriptional regulator n=1 Tax=Dactylosporangium sp. AC04546 TaxID=2862460 RepID=UPI001EDEA2B2|nr:MerR family transcriptional regulator [Dactylosporangium sp. AC04546]WVK81750.1 MerR family transcriptional regulator [Dactylosporangium sp. AC04546]
MTATGWTLDELTARVAAALGGSAYAGAPNGRVRDVPDSRAIRWYTTIGLVDRPAMRGRTALYGPRHLLQLVAVKRRQSEGRKIADIQAELADAPDETLREIARLPEADTDSVNDSVSEASGGPVRRRFWAEPPGPASRRNPPAQPSPASPPVPVPVPVPEPDPPREAGTAGPLMTGVPLGGGAVLLLPGPLGAADAAAVRAAAGPLIDQLMAFGLLPRPLHAEALPPAEPNPGSAQ